MKYLHAIELGDSFNNSNRDFYDWRQDTKIREGSADKKTQVHRPTVVEGASSRSRRSVDRQGQSLVLGRCRGGGALARALLLLSVWVRNRESRLGAANLL